MNSTMHALPDPPIIASTVLPEDLARITEAAACGMGRARESRLRHHPPGALGSRQYQDVHHELAVRLLPTGRWRKENREGYVVLRSLTAPVALAVAGGKFGPACGPLAFDGIEGDTHRDRAVEATARALASRNPRLFEASPSESHPQLTTIFVVLAQDQYRMRADLLVGDQVLAGRLRTVEWRSLIDQAGARNASGQVTDPSDALPPAVQTDVEVEWVTFPGKIEEADAAR